MRRSLHAGKRRSGGFSLNVLTEDEIEEIHESLWSWRGLKDDLRLLFGMMGQKFKRKRAPAVPE